MYYASDDGPLQSSIINTHLSSHYNILEQKHGLTSGKCNSQQPLPLILIPIQYIWPFRGPLKERRQPGLQADFNMTARAGE